MNGANCNSKTSFIVKATVLFGLATIALYLLTSYGTHLQAYSSYILIFGFVLLHIFMCGSHGKHGGHEGHGGHGGCCGEHSHGEHKHEEAEKKDQNAQITIKHENVSQHEHIKEKFK